MTETTILLAEDDSDDIFLFREALKRINVRSKLMIAQDGEMMIHLVKSQEIPPDLIFLDLNMPKKDGYTCLREIRQMGKFDNVPVIILSTSSNEQAVDQAYNGGANLYARKPDNFTDLIRIIDLCLNKPDQFFPKPSKEKFLLTV